MRSVWPICSLTLLGLAPLDAAVPGSMSTEECAVWLRERAFATSVEMHDSTAFASFLHADAVFISARGEATRGASAIAANWAPIIAGEDLLLRWYPNTVIIAGDPMVALSRGPYWIENPKAADEPRFLLGQFVSTWTKDAQGDWRVLFDGGGGNRPEPATSEDIQRLRSELSEDCPAQGKR